MNLRQTSQMNKGIKGKIMSTQFLQIIKLRIDKKFYSKD